MTLLHQQERFPVQAVCQLLALPHSSYYDQPVPVDDQAFQAALEQVATALPTDGRRRITQPLRRPPQALVVNRNQVQRLMADMGLLRPTKARTHATPNSHHADRRYPNLVEALPITHPDPVWIGDITYVRVRQDFI